NNKLFQKILVDVLSLVVNFTTSDQQSFLIRDIDDLRKVHERISELVLVQEIVQLLFARENLAVKEFAVPKGLAENRVLFRSVSLQSDFPTEKIIEPVVVSVWYEKRQSTLAQFL